MVVSNVFGGNGVMIYYSIVEPLVKGKYWSDQYIQGIQQEALKLKGEYVEIGFEDLPKISEENKSKNFRSIVIVNCVSMTWIPICLTELKKLDIHPLLLTPINENIAYDCSTVSLDFYSTFYSMFEYLQSNGHNRLALFGLNPNSANDKVKKNAFDNYQNLEAEQNKVNIFWNYGNLEDCCNKFLDNVDNYDAVVCANDVIAIKLIQFLKQKGKSVPKDCSVAAMGNTLLSGYISPQITIAEFDCISIGNQAVRLYNFLARNHEVSSLVAKVSGRIIGRQSTCNNSDMKSIVDCSSEDERKLSERMNENINFYDDADVKSILSIEKLLKECDLLDRNILYGLIDKKKYAIMAEENNVSEGTIKYRISRIKELTGYCSMSELLNIIVQYLV